MHMKTKFFKLFVTVCSIAALVLAGTSCSNDNEPEVNSRLQLKLTDAPSFLYSQVNIDIQGIEVYVGNTIKGNVEVKDGWLKLNLESAGVVNLLDFMNGKYKLLVDQEIEACEITKVRFNLGSDCSVKSLLTGNVSELKTRGSFMFDVDWDIQEGEDYTYIIDIDASQSIKIAFDSTINFEPEPYIRAFVDAFGGNVSGYVHPATAVKHIEITNGTKTLYTIAEKLTGALTGTDKGYFAFICLQPGDWTIKFVTKSTSGYQPKEINVKVTTGETYKIPDVVELSK